MSIIFKIHYLLFLLPHFFLKIQSQCLILPSSICHTCEINYYEDFYLSNLKLSLFSGQLLDSSNCIKKEIIKKIRNILILNSECTNCVIQNFDVIYENIPIALEEESKILIKFQYGELNIYLQEGKHYINEDNFKNLKQQFFRRTLVDIIIKPYDNKEVNIYLKTNEFFIFISKTLNIENINFFGNDLNVLCKTNLICCQNEKFLNEKSNCFLLNKKIDLSENNDFKGLFNIEYILENSNIQPNLNINNCSFNYFNPLNLNGFLSLFSLAPFSGDLIISNCLFEKNYFAYGIVYYSKYFDLFYDGKINDISNKFGDNINLLKESVLINNSNFTNYNNFYIESSFFSNNLIFLSNWKNILTLKFSFFQNISMSNIINIKNNGKNGNLYFYNNYLDFLNNSNLLIIEDIQNIELNTIFISNSYIFQCLITIKNVELTIMKNQIYKNITLNKSKIYFLSFINSIISISNSSFSYLNLKTLIYQSLLTINIINTTFSNISFEDHLFNLDQLDKTLISKSYFLYLKSSMSLFFLSLCEVFRIEKTQIKNCSLFSFYFILDTNINENHELLISNNNFSYFWKDEQTCEFNLLNQSIISLNNIYERIIKNIALPKIKYIISSTYIINNNFITQVIFQMLNGLSHYNYLYLIKNIFLNSVKFSYVFSLEEKSVSYIQNSYFEDNGVIEKKIIFSAFSDNTLLEYWYTEFSSIVNNTFTNTKYIDMTSGFVSGAPVGNFLEIINNNFITISSNENFNYKGLLLDSCKVLQIENNSFFNLKCSRKSFVHMHGAIILTASSSYSYVQNNYKAEIYNNKFINCNCVYGGSITILSYSIVFIRNCDFNNSKTIYFGGSFLIISCQIVIMENIQVFNSEGDDGGGFYLLNIANITINKIELNNILARKNGVIFMKAINYIKINSSTFNNTKSYMNGGLAFIFSSYVILENINISNSNSKLEAGCFLIHGGSNILFNNLLINNSKAKKAGVLSIVEALTVLINNCKFLNLYSEGNAGGMLFDVVKSIILVNIYFENSISNGMGTIYIKTENEYSLFTFNNISCIKTSAKQGSCLYFLSASNLFINYLEIMDNGIIPIYILWSFEITLSLKNIYIFNNFLNSQIIFCSGINLLLFNLKIHKNSADSPLIYSQNAKIKIIKAEILLNAMDFIFNLDDSNLEIENMNVINNYETLSFINSINSIINIIYTNIITLKSFVNQIIFIQKGSIVLNYFTSENNIGKFFTINNADLNISNSLFINNTSSEKNFANDVLIDNSETNKIFFFLVNTSFNIYQGISSDFIGAIIINMKNCSFHCKNTDRKVTAFSGSNIFQLIIENSNFSKFSDGAIKLNTEKILIFKSTILLFKEVIFSENTGILGGAIKLIGNMNISINNCIFQKNQAIFLKESENLQGIGGCVFFQSLDAKSSFFEINNTYFFNNSAYFACPTVFSQFKIYSHNNSIQSSDKVNNNFFSFPLNTRLISPIIKNQDQTLNITSGIYFDLTFDLIDFFSNIVVFDNSTLFNLKIYDQKTNQFFLENSISIAKGGKIIFKNIRIKTNPNSSFILNLVASFQGLISEEINSPLIENQYIFYARECYLGEIIQKDYSCFKCPLGTYSLLDPMQTEIKYQKCNSCPMNSECPGGSIISPQIGYYRKSNISTNVVSCTSSDACLGPNYSLNDSSIVHGECLVGNSGPLCFYCEFGYGKYEKTEMCKKCASIGTLVYVRIMVYGLFMILYILLNFHFAEQSKDKNDLSTCAKQLINHSQQLSVILLSSQTTFPSLKNFFSISDYLSFGNDAVVTNDCLMQHMYFNKEYTNIIKESVSIGLPLVFTILSFIFWILILYILSSFPRFKHLIDKMPKTIMQFGQRLTLFLVLSTFILYSLILKSCFSLFDCIQLDIDDKVTYLSNSPSLECWDSEHIKYLAFLGMPGIIIWGLSFPIFLFLILKGNSRLMSIAQKSGLFNQESMKKITSLKKAIIAEKYKIAPLKGNFVEHEPVEEKKEIPVFIKIEAKIENKIDGELSNDDVNKLVSDLKISKKFKSELQKKNTVLNAIKFLKESKTFSFFYRDYKGNFYYWESLIFFRKFIITFVSTLNETIQEELKTFVLVSFIWIFINFTTKNKPFKNNNANILEISSLYCLIIACLSSSVFNSEANMEIKYSFAAICMIGNITFFIFDFILIAKNVLDLFKREKRNLWNKTSMVSFKKKYEKKT